jgi:lipoate---protein ligase
MSLGRGSAAEAWGGLRVWFESTRDPGTNLSREEELFHEVENGELPEGVRFWVDSECLVKGKAKNARYGWYREETARKMGVRVLERSTGGGVVFHDEGNLNWSLFLRNSGKIVSPTTIFRLASGYLIRALGDLGVAAEFSPPNRVDVSGHKVSGMAARTSPRAVLVHGTLLLNANLERLNALCIPPAGSPPVANLAEWVRGIQASDVVGSFVRVLKESGFNVETAGGR